MNRGDTITLMLNYQVNGKNLIQGAYQEIELQINNQSSSKSIKKLLSDGGINWETVTYVIDGASTRFTGYVVHLTQEETFLLSGEATVQLRVKMNNEVGSSDESGFELGSSLSSTVI